MNRQSFSEQRKFGFTVGGIFVLLFGTLIPWIKLHTIASWAWIVGGTLLALALLKPQALYWPHRFWMRVGEILGWVNVRLILGVLFFAVFAPLGLLKRFFSSREKKEHFSDSYRILSSSRAPQSMERPY